VSAQNPRIWVLLGFRVGDNNQLLGLAEALGEPFETRTLGYKRLWALWLRLFPAHPWLLDRRSRRAIAPPWPDVVIGIGRRSVAVARWIKRRSGGRTRIVRLGNPRARPGRFDLVVTTAQYPVAHAGTVVTLPLAIARRRGQVEANAEERAWLDALPRPHLLLSLGGATRYWHFPTDPLVAAAEKLAARAAAAGGALIVVGSPRTPPEALDAIRAALADREGWRIAPPNALRYTVLLADADENFVTADSVSMMSEAVLAGKPVGLIPVEPDAEGERKLGSGKIRDIRRFWAQLEWRGLAGTVDRPVSGSAGDPAEIAADAVRRLLGDRVE
jgi:mitochondrial fission protein ELM1